MDKYAIGNTLPEFLPEMQELPGKQLKVVALVGGGMDGFLALHSLIHEYKVSEITLMLVDYGQISYKAESISVHKQATWLREAYLPNVSKVNVQILKDGLAPLLQNGELCAEVQKQGTMNFKFPEAAHDPANAAFIDSLKIYIPNRNARFMSMAFGLCELVDANIITFGAIGNMNMDNSLAFIQAAAEMQLVSGDRKIGIYAPFTLYSKSAAMHYAKTQDIVSVLGEVTVSCFYPIVDVTSDSTVQCGQCVSCKMLKQGFRFACVEDPFTYSN